MSTLTMKSNLLLKKKSKLKIKCKSRCEELELAKDTNKDFQKKSNY